MNSLLKRRQLVRSNSYYFQIYFTACVVYMHVLFGQVKKMLLLFSNTFYRRVLYEYVVWFGQTVAATIPKYTLQTCVV